MISISPPAIHAWAQTIAALGSTLAVGILVWDRVKPRPLQLSGYLSLTSSSAGPTAVGYLFSEAGERLILMEVAPGAHFEIALVPKQTPAARHINPIPLEWSRKPLKLRAEAERGHSGDAPLFRVAIRFVEPYSLWNRAMRAVFRPALIVSGVLPYRFKGRFKFGVTLPHSNLATAVRRRSSPSGER